MAFWGSLFFTKACWSGSKHAGQKLLKQNYVTLCTPLYVFFLLVVTSNFSASNTMILQWAEWNQFYLCRDPDGSWDVAIYQYWWQLWYLKWNIVIVLNRCFTMYIGNWHYRLQSLASLLARTPPMPGVAGFCCRAKGTSCNDGRRKRGSICILPWPIENKYATHLQ